MENLQKATSLIGCLPISSARQLFRYLRSEEKALLIDEIKQLPTYPKADIHRYLHESYELLTGTSAEDENVQELLQELLIERESRVAFHLQSLLQSVLLIKGR